MAKFNYILTVLLLWPGLVAADLELSGTVRNDSLFWSHEQNITYINILENQLVLQRKAENWKFYSDLRANLYTSTYFQETTGPLDGNSLLSVNLLRAFIKYYTGVGDLTVGKTYINFGNIGVFNPFELDRSLTVTDLSYTKAGLIAVAYDFAWGDLSGGKIFVSPEARGTSAAFGGSLYTHVQTFDVGIVADRLNQNDNCAGLYFKGDAEVGLQGSWAWHVNDSGTWAYSEVVLGADYSFFEGRLLTTVQGYYNGQGLGLSRTTTSFFSLESSLQTEAFPNKFYMYANVTYQPDEFSTWQVDAFINLQDHSSLLMPMGTVILANGLNLSAQLILPTGVGHSQYSRDLYGHAVGLVKVEAKL